MNGDTPAQPEPVVNPPQPDGSWQYKPGSQQTAQASPANQPQGLSASSQASEFSWTASEFIDHSKSPLWYITLASLVLGIAVVAYIMLHDIVSVVTILIMGALLGVVGGRKPRVMDYQLDNHGLNIGQRLYPYADYKSFTIIHDGPIVCLTLYPLKRFMPPVIVYYDFADEEHITEVLSRYLPLEVRQPDATERFARRIRL